ncbi:MAG TPA: hypothetical protein VJ552_11655 [Sediminibacterium sp.]|nr:hypothetical protein [Sediminibacterium sp.]
MTPHFWARLAVYFILIVIAVPTFFIWRWLFKKFVRADNTNKIATWVATIVTTPLIYVGILLILLVNVGNHPSYKFDKEKWVSDRENRYKLSKDIIGSKMLIGKTKSEVRQLLGNEDNTDESDYWTYYLGLRPGFAIIDPDVLDIQFEDGKVTKVGQHET